MKTKSAQKPRPAIHYPLPDFRIVQKKYGLTDPGQIQMKILWDHLQALILAQFPGEETKHKLGVYSRDWKTCDKAIEENGTKS